MGGPSNPTPTGAIKAEDPTLGDLWQLLQKMTLKSAIALGSGIATCISAIFYLGSQFSGYASVAPMCNDLGGVYQEETQVPQGFDAKPICAGPTHSTLIVSCNTDRTVLVVEISYNVIYRTERDATATAPCGRAPSDHPLCMYSAEWRFNGKLGAEARWTGLTGRVIRRLGLDECAQGQGLSPDLSEYLAEVKRGINQRYNTGNCELVADKTDDNVSSVKYTCYYDGRKNESHSGVFVKIPRV